MPLKIPAFNREQSIMNISPDTIQTPQESASSLPSDCSVLNAEIQAHTPFEQINWPTNTNRLFNHGSIVTDIEWDEMQRGFSIS